jgi:hypothetical protein
MRRVAWAGLAVLSGTIAFMASASGQTGGEATPIYGVRLPAGYRDWPDLHRHGRRAGQRHTRQAGQRCRDEGVSQRHASVPRWHDHRPACLEADPVGGEQPSCRAGGREAIGRRGGSEAAVTVIRRRARNQCAVHGEGLQEARRRPAVGDLHSSTTASPPTRRCTTPALHVTRLLKTETSSSPVTRNDSPERVGAEEGDMHVSDRQCARIGKPGEASTSGRGGPRKRARRPRPPSTVSLRSSPQPFAHCSSVVPFAAFMGQNRASAFQCHIHVCLLGTMTERDGGM